MRDFDVRTLLESYSNAALLPMTKARGVFTPGQTTKGAQIAALAAVLRDAESVRSAYEKIGKNARLLLALLREMGGSGTAGDLSVAANRIGLGDFDDCLTELMRYALVVYVGAGSVKHELWRNVQYRNYGSAWSPSFDYEVMALPEALALVQNVSLPGPAHQLKPFEGEPGIVHEQSPSPLLHGLFNVVRWCGGRQVKIAKTTGMASKNDLKTLAKQFNGDDGWAQFLIALGQAVGLLRTSDKLLKPGPDNERFFAQAPREQVRHLCGAWQKLATWSEFFRIPEIATSDDRQRQLQGSWDDVPDARDLVRARTFLLDTLRRQSDHLKHQGWQSFHSLVEVVKGENPGFLIPREQRRNTYSYYGYSHRESDDYSGFWPAGGSMWRDHFKKNQDWDKVEGRYIRQVFTEPLTWLGLVATARDAQGEVVAFRLTPLGRQVLDIASENEMAPLESEAVPAGKPLTVQPNFEIIAYTEPEHLQVLFQLERFADRTGADRVAHYRLTRESVYRGAQDGLGAADMKEFLARHSKSEVPQNVAFSIDDWHRLIEQVVIRRSAVLLEADSTAELDALLAQLPEGAATRLGDAWALIERAHEAAARRLLKDAPGAVAFDYETAIEQAFTVNGQLQLDVPRENLDLWLRSKLEQFAEAAPDQGNKCIFHITREGLSRAAQLGVNFRDVLQFLNQFAVPPLPADVELTLRGWGGVVTPVALEETFVLVTQEGLIDRLAEVDELRALLWLKISDRAALVKRENEPTLRAALEARGISADAKPSARVRPPSVPKTAAGTPRPLLPTHRRAPMVPTGKPRVRSAVAARPAEDEVTLERDLSSTVLWDRLETAMEETRCVVIDYQGKASRNRRKIAPLELVEQDGHKYMSAWDFWRQDYRLFRLDRVLGFAALEEKFDPKKYA